MKNLKKFGLLLVLGVFVTSRPVKSFGWFKQKKTPKKEEAAEVEKATEQISVEQQKWIALKQLIDRTKVEDRRSFFRELPMKAKEVVLKMGNPDYKKEMLSCNQYETAFGELHHFTFDTTIDLNEHLKEMMWILNHTEKKDFALEFFLKQPFPYIESPPEPFDSKKLNKVLNTLIERGLSRYLKKLSISGLVHDGAMWSTIPKITPETMKMVNKFENLKKLAIENSIPNPNDKRKETIEILAKNSSIESLSIDEELHLDHIAAIKKLKSLSIINCSTLDMRLLNNAKNLTSLEIIASKEIGHGLPPQVRFKNLESCTILSKLKLLFLKNCTGFDMLLDKTTNLRTLTFYLCKIDPKVIIDKIQKIETLKTLSFFSTYLAEDDIINILNSFKKLEELYIIDLYRGAKIANKKTYKISDAVIDILSPARQTSHSLSHLYFSKSDVKNFNKFESRLSVTGLASLNYYDDGSLRLPYDRILYFDPSAK